LASGIGKGRMKSDASSRRSRTWRVLVGSSGELKLSTKVREGGRKPRAGQEVRFIDIPADAEKGFGVFDHGGPDNNSGKLADEIKTMCCTHYGTAGPEFIARMLARGLDRCADDVRASMAEFVRVNLVDGGNWQVQRVLGAFALVAAAGSLAEDLGVLTWPKGAATKAARHCFKDWLRDRGGKEAGEDRDALAQVRLFMEKNGDARFQKIFEKALDDGAVIDPDRPVVNRAGYRKGGEWWVFPQVWEDEICEGRDAKAIAKMLEAKGMLKRPPSAKDERTYQSVRKVDGENIRCYVLTANLLSGSSDSDQSDPSAERPLP
jgi:uncharacterized protein (DUF927 family)